MLGNYRVAAHLVASSAVLTSTQLVSWFGRVDLGDWTKGLIGRTVLKVPLFYQWWNCEGVEGKIMGREKILLFLLQRC
jgi:hypothetical protein